MIWSATSLWVSTSIKATIRSDICLEHEITGDVLLEMDAHTLKEIDIIQFGKRVKIANAINELRRPGSMRSIGPASMRSQQMSPGYSSHHRAPSITAVYPTSPGFGPEYQQPQTQQHSRAASMSGPVETIPEHEAYQPQQRSDAAALGFNQVSCSFHRTTCLTLHYSLPRRRPRLLSRRLTTTLTGPRLENQAQT